MTPELAAFFAGVIWGAVVVGASGFIYLRKKYNVTKKLPYRWVCQKADCHVEYSSNVWEATIAFADKHNRIEHQE